MKNYWIDRIREREKNELIVAARWTPPTDDESGWYPLRPLTACAEAPPGAEPAEPLYVSTPPAEPNQFFAGLNEQQSRVFTIDVGQSPSFDAETFMTRLKEQFRKRKAPKEPACEKKWERLEIMSQMGTSFILKDDGQSCGDWAKANEPFDFGPAGEKGTYSLKQDVGLSYEGKMARLEELKLEVLARNPCGLMVAVPNVTVTPPVENYTLTLSNHIERNDEFPDQQITVNLNSQWEL